MRRRRKALATPRPFLKWVGGKGQLLDKLVRCVNAASPFNCYHEPFVGGGALFFELARTGKIAPAQAFLSDNNPHLIEAYQGLMADVDGVIERLEAHAAKHGEAHYYATRGQVPEGLPARAARIIYLNKTCFNGLFRENSKGEFNVPIGRYKNPLICDAQNLRAVAEVLAEASIETRPFESVLDYAQPGDFVYFDPPYHPVSKTASFTDYAKGGFGEASQRQLAEVYRALSEKEVAVLLSNSMTPLIKKLYKDFKIDEVQARRMVNSRADRRGAVSEALVRNFPLRG